MTYYKVLDTHGKPFNGGFGKWYLPNGRKPGKWMAPIVGDLVPCKNGYHLCRRVDLVLWLGPEIYEAEYRGEIVEVEDKVVVREARLVRRVDTWADRTARLFACDCAERALKAVVNPDQRSVEAVRVSRLFADGQASSEDLAAARDAARYAARDAFRDAAWDAARYAARHAAWDTALDAVMDTVKAAAGDTAWDTAWDTAGDTAWDTERRWQTARLFHYLEGVSDESRSC